MHAYDCEKIGHGFPRSKVTKRNFGPVGALVENGVKYLYLEHILEYPAYV